MPERRSEPVLDTHQHAGLVVAEPGHAAFRFVIARDPDRHAAEAFAWAAVAYRLVRLDSVYLRRATNIFGSAALSAGVTPVFTLT